MAPFFLPLRSLVWGGWGLAFLAFESAYIWERERRKDREAQREELLEEIFLYDHTVEFLLFRYTYLVYLNSGV
ncbi:hypothetical protein F5Y14DRAFT_407736 [Nemania sp. NC0429]|nr:hypothetical protein F5Y14DRAFT_407736 [Nemania sp. NC0429]